MTTTEYPAAAGWTAADYAGLACVSSAIPAAERPAHARLARKLFGDGAAPAAVDDAGEGYRLTMEASALGDVARWVANERLCCPFLRFTIDVAPGADALTVTLTGPAGTRALLDAELFAEVAR